jgi:hypothetical protein
MLLVDDLISDFNTDDDDLSYLPSIPFVDAGGNFLPEVAPRSVDELDVGVKPVNIDDLSKITNLAKARLISQRSTEKFPYEVTGADKTGVLDQQSLQHELNIANIEMIIKEKDMIGLSSFYPTTNESFSGDTNK